MTKQLNNLFKLILISYIGLTGIISFSQSKIKDATIVSSVTPNENAILELESNNRGFLLPRMTTAQRDLIPDPIPTGLIIYNITKNCLEFYNNTMWYNACGDNPPVILPKLDCASTVLNPASIVGGQVYAGTAALSYTDGNGKPYSAASIPSTGVTGLTATIGAGTFANGSGSITFSVKGTPHSNGIASFSINLGGIVCTLECKVIPNQLRIGGWGSYDIASPQFMPGINAKVLNINNLGIEGPAPTITYFNPSFTGDVLKEQYEILNVSWSPLSAAQVTNLVDYVNLGGVLYVWCDAGYHTNLWNAFGGTGGIGSGAQYITVNSDPINSGVFGTVPNGTQLSGYGNTYGYIPTTGVPSGSRIFATTANGVGGVIMAGYGGRVVFIWDEGINRLVSGGNQVNTITDIWSLNIWAYLIDKSRGL
jgi:hypothetical protein